MSRVCKDTGKQEIMKCIFTITPQECSFVRDGKCHAMGGHIITCAQNHRRLMIRADSREILIDIFTKHVVDSPDRIKVVSGQDGRDIIAH